MNSEKSISVQPPSPVVGLIALDSSPYINEPLPNWEGNALCSRRGASRRAGRAVDGVQSRPTSAVSHANIAITAAISVALRSARGDVARKGFACPTLSHVAWRQCSLTQCAPGIIASGLHVSTLYRSKKRGHLYGLKATFAAASYSALALARIARDLKTWLRISMNSLPRPIARRFSMSWHAALFRQRSRGS